MAVINVTGENFENEVMQADKPVLVDFWAAWCGPCRMLSPVVDEISEEVENIKVCKVNIDEEPQLADRFEIRSIPSLVLIQNGKTVKKSVGVRPKQEILDMLGE